jgi:hypothetical protein
VLPPAAADLVYVAVSVVFFALAIAFAEFCKRIR